MRVGGRFAGEVPGIEFHDGGIEVVGIQRYERHDSLVTVDLDDVEDVGAERVGSLVVARGVRTAEDEVSAAGRDGVCSNALDADLGECGEFSDHGITPLSASRAHHQPAIIVESVVGQYISHGVPVPVRKARLQAFVRLACRVFGSGRRAAQQVEPRDGSVEVFLVEDFAAVDELTFDCEDVDRPPFGFETLARGQICRMGDDSSEAVEAMHNLDVGSGGLVDFLAGTQVSHQLARPKSCHPAVVDINQVRCSGWYLVPTESGEAVGDH